ncbi:hypothetical protein POTOM_035351 [Populus tomentosa]|uniref:xyloglucan 6-xylosyltransferase n=1 Tax=Populus tomentosa TaxID=118781 RepID=A0A8X7YSV4_POPTO|nr:hypothetical protein POTOM_035351 [Populus tomentosa]
MLDRCIGTHRVRQIQRAIRHGKITLLCLCMTVVVLRGTIGAGKFGTPEQDFNDLKNHFYAARKHGEPHRVLTESNQPNNNKNDEASNANDANNYATFDISKILVDEGEDEKPDPNRPYSLGPKISDWNQLREKWLSENPSFSNFIKPNKPRVLLVTGSSPKPCENPVGDHYLLKSIKNKIDYCRLHGIEIFYNMALLDAEMAGFWAKLPLIRKLLLSHPEVEFLWWMDSDAMFTDMAFEVPWERYKDSNFVMHGWNEMVYDEKNWIGLNTGSFLLRNCQWSLDLLDAWSPMGPKGKIRDEAGKVLTRELKNRPVFEADDQSAMVYLLATQRDKWGDKVYLENAYYLHGYWGILVDRYEEMIENYRPGLGDHRWPLVTHFVGCKPCGKFGDYSVERCLKQMDRAFNFGDNQILQIYGFTHKSLASRRVRRVRNETTNPLEVKDELGLLHPAFKAVRLVLLLVEVLEILNIILGRFQNKSFTKHDASFKCQQMKMILSTSQNIAIALHEEMTDHRLQDLGGHCRLLVIKFLVWKLCWKFGDVERCSKQMNQQSNFQFHGLLINLLSVGELGLRDETSNPLEVTDELGLHCPALKMPRYHHLESFDNVMDCLQLLFFYYMSIHMQLLEFACRSSGYNILHVLFLN